jgi:hypothetical protein
MAQKAFNYECYSIIAQETLVAHLGCCASNSIPSVHHAAHVRDASWPPKPTISIRLGMARPLARACMQAIIASPRGYPQPRLPLQLSHLAQQMHTV